LRFPKNSLAVVLLITGLSANGQSLKDSYKDYFPIGVAVSPEALTGEEGELIRRQFNSLTAENVMKMGPIHPQEDRYNWEPADKIVAFAQANNMRMRGHCLVWHRQTPEWIFQNASREVLLQRMKEHITSVVSRYKGKIYAWDVVNEAINDDGSYRESQWYKIIGEEYIAKAFQYAHEADPDALLFYNDYNTESPVKREKIFLLLKKLKEAGIPLHAVGIQGHWNLDQSASEVAKTIDTFATLGLLVQVTELDLSVYKDKSETQKDLTTELEQRQADLYKDLFKVFRDHKNTITGITFWNVSDKHSWLDNFPTRDRKNYPLLFDQQLKPKKAYFEVVKF
jgi:endo-1,4-beta-xylanase